MATKHLPIFTDINIGLILEKGTYNKGFFVILVGIKLLGALITEVHGCLQLFNIFLFFKFYLFIFNERE